MKTAFVVPKIDFTTNPNEEKFESTNLIQTSFADGRTALVRFVNGKPVETRPTVGDTIDRYGEVFQYQLGPDGLLHEVLIISNRRAESNFFSHWQHNPTTWGGTTPRLKNRDS